MNQPQHHAKCQCSRHLVTRDALKGHTVSKNGSISFFFFLSFFFFFFLVIANLYINLFIKPSPLLPGMYSSDCLQQKQANQNPFLSLISLGRGPAHPYLCDVNASFDFFLVATNRYINLFIKLTPLLLGMYCSDCL